MSILFFARSFYPNIGGVERHVLRLSKLLIEKGHTVTVITESSLTKKPEKDTYKKINIIRIPSVKDNWQKKFFIWRQLFKLKDILQNSDIIHCHDVFFWYLPFRFIYPTKPVFTTFHGYESFPLRKKAILIRKISEKLSFGNICVGDFIPKWYGTKANFITYGAVDPPCASVLNRSLVKKPSPSAVFFGRLDEQTGILEYLRAIKLIRQKYPDFKFLVVGDGKYKSIVSQKAKVINSTPTPEKFFSQYGFVFVSRYLSILESLAYKKLVFALFDNPVKEDYLKMSPFAKYILTYPDAFSLAQGVISALKYPQKDSKKLSLGYSWTKKQNWENLLKVYLSLWNKSLKNS